jgi:SAM-dependent methyltransferase
MFRVEGTHWWYSGMQTISETILDHYLPSHSKLDILDAGCGTGAAMTGYLSKYGIVTGIDLSPLALAFSKKRDASRLGCASVLDLPFAASTFDLVTSFDVFYEDSVQNDATAVREFVRVLRPGGWICLRLPAYDWLRGQHDRVIHTARRYTRQQVLRLLQNHSLQVKLISYANMFLFPLALLKRTFERILQNKTPASDLAYPIGPFNFILTKILSSEAALLPGLPLPFGLSVVALAQKN